MYEWDDILVLGDSFAYSRHLQTDWPMALALKLTGKEYSPDRVPRGIGFPGCSWWSVRNRLLKEIGIKVPKVLVVCHTEMNRIPSDEDYGLTLTSVSTNSVVSPQGRLSSYHPIMRAAIDYYRHLYSEKFHMWMFQQWINELDSITMNAGIDVVIHLQCYEGTENIVSSHGITSEQFLFEIHKRVTGEKPPHLKDAEYFRNHMNDRHSIHLANSLYDAIINFTPSDNGKRKNLNILP